MAKKKDYTPEFRIWQDKEDNCNCTFNGSQLEISELLITIMQENNQIAETIIVASEYFQKEILK